MSSAKYFSQISSPGLRAESLRFESDESPGVVSENNSDPRSKSAQRTQSTIPYDRTNHGEIYTRNLVELLHGKPDGERTTRPSSGNKYVSEQDHQSQLMLLEQQRQREMSQQTKNSGLNYGQNNLPNRARNGVSSPSAQSQPYRHPTGNSMVVAQQYQMQPRVQEARLPAKEVHALREQMALLEAKLNQYESTPDTPTSFRFQYLYRLRRAVDIDDDGEVEHTLRIFSDPPEIVIDQNNKGHLRCSHPLRDLDLYLALHKDISFVIFRDYDGEYKIDSSWPEDVPPTPKPFSESVYPISDDLKSAINVLFNEIPGVSHIESRYESSGEIFAPYHFLYHSRNDLWQLNSQLSQSTESHLNLLLMYVGESFGAEWATVDSLLEKEMITADYLKYLFKPGEVVVEAQDNNYVGYVVISWPSEEQSDSNSEEIPDTLDFQTWDFGRPPPRNRGRQSTAARPKQQKRKGKQFTSNRSETMKAWTLAFDGNFFRSFKNLTINFSHVHGQPTGAMGADSNESIIGNEISNRALPITSLNVFPLKYAPDDVREILRRRGNTFWKCRNRRLVSYHGTRGGEDADMSDERYMIDMDSYNKLHPNSNRSELSSADLLPQYLVGAETINDPNGKYQFLLPANIKAYNLRHKKWFLISADYISDVKWNREAFQTLVMERKSKELIQALVTNQIESEKGTDLIAGKGNGLILLLHGGPGTGKTLTAESVAEIAEKPLYRVTCGDVGTKAEQVERYLESVLYLGRIWGCVVLLDEADVFLEQRSLEDLERNALVSVFLRVLEYYDGILVLTSNRVGTFDEAFRSRIQLALHYPNLGPPQRFRIWQTFIDRLSKISNKGEIDIDDLRDNLHLLKEEKMNGRQIRNVITTARQYASWKKEPLTYQYLKDVIEISCRFDSYLSKFHGGFSDDEIAQDDGLRLA